MFNNTRNYIQRCWDNKYYQTVYHVVLYIYIYIYIYIVYNDCNICQSEFLWISANP